MQELERNTDWIQRSEGAPPGTLIKRGKRHVTVYLPRPTKDGHWLLWLVIVATTLRSAELGWVGAGVAFLVTSLLYLWWWFSRFRILFCEDRLIVRYGVGFLSSRKVMPYTGLECELEDSAISLFHFDEHQGKHLTLPGNAWLSNLIESVAIESEAASSAPSLVSYKPPEGD